MRTLILCLALTIPAAADPADSVARVDRQDGGHGSGVVVHSAKGRSLVLTNRHVSPNGRQETNVAVGRREFDAKWLGVDPDCDLAALEVEAELPVAVLADREPDAKANVTLISHPAGWRKAAKAGPYLGRGGMFAWNEIAFGGARPGRRQEWQTVTRAVGGQPVQQVELFYQSEVEYAHAGFASVPGDSGGPVFHGDRLVGLCWGGNGQRTNLVPLDAIRAFVAKHTGKGATGTPTPAPAGPLREMPPLSKDK
jgi:hypothetical protein